MTTFHDPFVRFPFRRISLVIYFSSLFNLITIGQTQIATPDSLPDIQGLPGQVKEVPPVKLLPSTTCNNSNFADSTFDNWSGCSGTWCDITGPAQTRCNNPFTPYNPPCNNPGQPWTNTPTGGHFAIQNPGPDPCIPALNKVFPGETHSALIGNRTCNSGGGYVDQLTYQIAYNPSNSFFIYRSAVVLANITDPTHNTADRRPRFTIEIKDNITGNILDSLCGVYDLYPGDSITTWNPGPNNYVWKDWSTIGVDFSSLAGVVPGQVLDVVFTIHGCAYTAHTAYAYISATCDAMSISLAGCEGSGQVTLIGPPGFIEYKWQGPYCPDTIACPIPPPIYYGDSVTITAAQGAITGNVFDLIVTASNGCLVKHVQQIISFTSVNPGFSSLVNCVGNVSTFIDTSASTNPSQPIVNRRWRFDADSAFTPLTANDTIFHTYNVLGQHIVTIESLSQDSCMGTITDTINVGPPPTFINLVPGDSICSGDSVGLSLTLSQIGADATWISTVTTGTATITNNPVSQSGLQINDLIVNTGAVNAMVTYSITPWIGDCTGVPDTIEITVYPSPVPGIVEQAGIPLCVNSTITYTTEPGQNSYAWQALPDGIIAEIPPFGNVITVTWPTAGAKTVTVNYVDAITSCTASTPSSYALTINPLPVPGIVQQSGVPLCMNSIITYTTEPGQNNYAWQALPDGIIAEVPPFGNMITVTWPTIGAKTVTANYVDPLTLCTAAMPTPFALTINPLPDPGIIQQAGIPPCLNSTLTYTTEPGQNNYEWQALPDGIIAEIPPFGNVITVTWPTTGNKTVKVNYIDPVTLCTATLPSSFLLNVKPLPVPGIVQQAGIPLCQNSTLTYTTEPGKNNYDWQALPDGIIAETPPYSNLITVTWPSAGAKTVTLNYQDPLTLCSAATPTSFALNINPLPVPVIVQQSGVPLCLNSTLTYSTEAGQNSYDWQALPDGIISETPPYGNMITVTWPTFGAKTVTANYIDPVTLCTAATPTVYSLTINPLPVPGIIQQSGVPLCQNSTLTYTTEPGQNNYVWQALPDGIISEIPPYGNVITVTWPTVGAKTVRANYIDAVTLCTAAVPTSFALTINPLPVPGIVQQAGVPLCQNSTITYTTEPGQNNYGWQAVPDGIIAELPPYGNQVTVTWPSAGAKTVTVNYVDPITLCTAAVPTSFVLNINPLPVPVITQQSGVPFCQNATLTYSTEPGKNNYDWQTLPDGIISEIPPYGDLITVTWPTAGAKTVMVNYVDNITGCTASVPSAFNLVINPLPVPSFTAGENSVCLNIPDKIYTTEAGQTNYLWTIPPQATITAGGTVNDNSVTLTWTSVGNYSITVNYTEPATLCTAPVATQFDVTVKPLPDPTFTNGENSVCLNIPGKIYTTQPGMSGYIWTIPPEATITAGGTVNDNSVTLTWTTAGNYSISVNYTEPTTQCTAPNATQFAVTVEPLPVPTIITGENSVCLNIPGKIYTTEAGKTNYLWTIPPEATITAGGTVNDNSVTLTWTSAGSYSISVNYTEPATQCTAPAATQYPVIVHPLPVPVIAGPNSVCKNTTVQYTTEPGMTGYQWIVDPAYGTMTPVPGFPNAIDVTWNVTGSTQVTVNYVDANNCTAPTPSIYPVTIQLLPTPTIIPPGHQEVCKGDVFIYNTQQNANTYTWDIQPLSGRTILSGGTSTSSFIEVRWDDPGAYVITLNYSIGIGCTAAAPTLHPVTVNELPDPVITTFPGGPICGYTSYTYTTTGAPGHTYLWSVTGGTITNGGGVNNAYVTILWGNTPPVSIDLIETAHYTGVDCSVQAATFLPTFTPWPDPAGSISGPASVCPLWTGQVYTVPAIPYAFDYEWIYTGAGVTLIPGGNSVTINFSGVATSGLLTVKGHNDCGYGPVSPTYSITVNPLPVVAYALCNDAFTTKNSKPFILAGGSPFGPTGTYHLNNPNAAALPGNVFNPGDPAVFIGSNTIYYTYTTVNSCKASASQTITVLSPNINFQCGVNMLTDPRDNNATYRTIQIGSNCWMGENLRYGFKVTFPSPNQPQPQTDNCINEKYCLPTDNANCTTYGGLYQWDELIQYGQTQAPYQGVCPPEWHIPTVAEWQDLIDAVALMTPGDGLAGTYLSYATGFKAFRYGIYYLNNSWAYTTGSPTATMFWTSTFSNGKPIVRGLNTISPSVSLYESSRANAFPVRCVKD